MAELDADATKAAMQKIAEAVENVTAVDDAAAPVGEPVEEGSFLASLWSTCSSILLMGLGMVVLMGVVRHAALALASAAWQQRRVPRRTCTFGRTAFCSTQRWLACQNCPRTTPSRTPPQVRLAVARFAGHSC